LSRIFYVFIVIHRVRQVSQHPGKEGQQPNSAKAANRRLPPNASKRHRKRLISSES
jgi:hypothetical protein